MHGGGRDQGVPGRGLADQLQRYPVVGQPIQLLGSAEQQRRHHLGVLARLAQGRAHHRRIVLAVDQRQQAIGHGPPPAFGRFFSYARVSCEKRMIRSRP